MYTFINFDYLMCCGYNYKRFAVLESTWQLSTAKYRAQKL